MALYISVPPNSPQVVWTKYIILTHEFGHMLGCPDEYAGIQCTGIKELINLESLSRTGIAAQKVEHAIAPAPGKKMWEDTAKPGTVDSVTRLQAQQQTFAKAIHKSGVEAPVFADKGFMVNQAEYTASQKAYADGYDAIKTSTDAEVPKQKIQDFLCTRASDRRCDR